ncbi:4956_t:CDS:1 [Paraglomus brasilianum]|uniref:4956_t:CDS:1 n=1 Tax=Paraglomus brasilianum TaxID=144538 RepID=A0A9N9C201_9GLOM|nr:4956_t:CDS:1 [Paraglomus brasilianum]
MIKLINLSALCLLLAAIIFVHAAPINPPTITAIDNSTVYCLFLPPQPGGDIASHENDAVPFCTQATPNAPNANILPSGFIVTSHYVVGDGFVQVTGRIDGSKYNLSSTDMGGQYDSVGAPPGATCAGSKKFVELVEPADGFFCIRCCTDSSKCNTGKSTEGCNTVIPGDYT